ncbi:unnamed protein product [Colias eurytheme]|nr:unnamed protein product [Colias eurytheme]
MIWIILSLTLFLLCLNLTKNFNYWKKKGIKYITPYPFVGSIIDIYLLKQSPAQMAEDIYKKYPKEKVIGLFRSSQPILLVRDPAILKRIFSTDFPYFYSRGLKIHNEEPMLRNLFFADGDLWRSLRKRLTHAFTSAKLRAMYPLIEQVAVRLQKKALDISEENGIFDAEELMASYTTDVIGSCGFGLNVDSINNHKCAFRNLSKRLFKFGVREIFFMVLKDNLPQIFGNLKYFPEVEEDIIKLVKEIQKKRNFTPSGRNDFMDIMIECKKEGAITCESIERTESNGKPTTATLEITDELIAAQAFVFLAAGYETSSFVTSCTLHYLSHNLDYQRKIQQQLDEVLEKHDNRLSFEAVKEMTYIECAMKETLRLLPAGGFLTRECVRPYYIPEINATIDKGVLIILPIQGVHRDPKYYESPDEYLPERFLSNDIGSQEGYTYFPFGAGPRMCIGERLGQTQSIAGLAAILSKCSVTPAPNTRRDPLISPLPNIVQSITGGLPLVLKKRTALVS